MARIVVIGTGIAGLTTALALSGDHDVIVVTKDRCGESNTALAQGGVAGVLDPADSIASHVEDTLAAGAGLCDPEAVRVLCTEGPERIRELAAAGVRFDRRGDPANSGTGTAAAPGSDADVAGWARGLEGAHSFPRICHAGGDATGRAIVDALVSRLLAEVAANRIELRTTTMLVDIVTEPVTEAAEPQLSAAAGARSQARGLARTASVTGVSVLGPDGEHDRIAADAVVLATGGAGQVFAHTTNPLGATGDGLAAAIRAGAAVRDLEFVQFHPTALAGSGFLVSEAVRGAGATLRDAQGRRFMPDRDPRAELAPRDVVALGLHRTMAAQNGLPCHLDARGVPDAAERFPSIAGHLSDLGLDLTEDLIPVTPAAHYFMGGVATDLEGRTSIPGLFAVGEVACTGVHGANRLASNSLLEGAVFAARAARAIGAQLRRLDAPFRKLSVPHGSPAEHSARVAEPTTGVADSLSGVAEDPLAPLPRADLQVLTWAHLGLERSAEGLHALIDRLSRPAASVAGTDMVGHLGEIEGIETANLTLIARTMAAQALARRGSVGAHVRTDAPADHHEEAGSC